MLRVFNTTLHSGGAPEGVSGGEGTERSKHSFNAPLPARGTGLIRPKALGD